MRGDRFFYPNVLQSIGQHERSPWFDCACCPSNVGRFIPSIPGLAYAVREADIFINLFLGGEASFDLDGNRVRLVQETRYPWEGSVRIMVQPSRAGAFALNVRIPGWARNEPVPGDLYRFVDVHPGRASLQVNGEPVEVELSRGYARIERTWEPGDTVDLVLPLPVRRVVAHDAVGTNRGRVALQRGPVVYCLEWPDNHGQVLDLVIPDDAPLETGFSPDLLGGVVTVRGMARTAMRTADGRVVVDGQRPFVAIPYYGWAHRGPGEMTVWPARVPEAARPRPADTLTSRSRTSASFVHVSLDAIKDQNLPADSADASDLHLDFWPHKGTREWVLFEWDQPRELSAVKVYWFDDTGRGECRVPAGWGVSHRDPQGAFHAVNNRSPYGVAKDTFNTVAFDPVTTSALRIEIDLQPEFSAGLHEVVIE